GYVTPAPSVMRTDCLIVLAAIIFVAAGAATVFSLLYPEVSQPVAAGTSVAAQQPSEPQEVKSSYVPRWGVWLAADLSEGGAWALYRERVRPYASWIGDREPVVLFRQLPGMGKANRYIIALADDDRAPLDKFCEALTAAGSTCNVMRNEFGP